MNDKLKDKDGTQITCEKCKGSKFSRLKVYGRSKQVATTGAQLLNFNSGNITSRDGMTINISDDGGFFVDGTPQEPYTNMYNSILSLSAGDYYFWGGNGAAGTVYGQITITKPDGTLYYVNDGKVTIDGTEKEIKFTIQNGNNIEHVDHYTLYTMLNAGSTPLPWEPYTGGQPSPSPEYPQEIVNAGGDGSLNVMVRGKNVFAGRFYYAQYSSGILYITERRKDEEVKFPYQPRNETYGVCKVLKCQKGKNYVISVTNPNKNAVIGMAEYETIEKAIDVGNTLGFAKVDSNELTKSYTAKSDGILACGIAGKWTNGTTTLHECTESELLQVEEASEATSYEPYHEPQSMSVTTPNGLPGIPVSSGGSYTDADGQQWICDEIDFGRGQYTQRIAYTIVDGDAIKFKARGEFWNLPDGSSPGCGDKNYAINNFFSKNMFGSNGRFNFVYALMSAMKKYFETADELNEFCKSKYDAGTPLILYYALTTPIETPLAADQLNAYKALHTYADSTAIISNDADAHIGVTYRRLRD